MSLRFTIRITTQGPFLTAGEGAAALGVDVSRARDACGKPVIPGSHVAGRLREALVRLWLLAHPPSVETAQGAGRDDPGQELAFRERAAWSLGDDQAGKLFGRAASGPRSTGSPGLPSRLRFSRFRRVEAGTTPAKLPLLHRIGMDRTRRTAQDQALAFLDAGAHGMTETWEGTVEADLPAGDRGYLEVLLLACLHDLRAFGSLGSQRSIGMGRIREVSLRSGTGEPGENRSVLDVDRLASGLDWLGKLAEGPGSGHSRTAATQGSFDAMTRFRVRVRLCSPLVVGDYNPSDNLFETRDDIPGSVLKRALADLWLADQGRSADNGWVGDPGFDAIQVRFGFPVADADQADRPWPYPFTTYAWKNWRWPEDDPGAKPPGDVLREDAARKGASFQTHSGESRRQFATDVECLSGWAPGGKGATFRPDHVLISRTAIDPLRQGSAESMLFSYRAVAESRRILASDGGESWEPQRYLFEVRCPESLKVTVRQLLTRVTALGKGWRRGFGEVKVEAVDELDPSPVPAGPGNIVPVMLATEALLLPPDLGIPVGSPLQDRYRQAWCSVLHRLSVPGTDAMDGILHVDGVYVGHRLRGAVTASGPNQGPPILLTRAGSVFLLRFEGLEETVLQELLRRLEDRGAEIPGHLDRVEQRWGCFCPYRASNGYGEVVLFHPVHGFDMEGVS